MTKKVPTAPFCFKISRIFAVLTDGPSSNVKNTSLIPSSTPVAITDLGCLTVTLATNFFLKYCAVTFVEPSAFEVKTPLSLIEAMFLSSVDHLTFALVPSSFIVYSLPGAIVRFVTGIDA